MSKHPERFWGRRNVRIAESPGLHGRVAIGFLGWFGRRRGLDLLLDPFRISGLGQGRLAPIGDGCAADELKRYLVANRLHESAIFARPHRLASAGSGNVFARRERSGA